MYLNITWAITLWWWGGGHKIGQRYKQLSYKTWEDWFEPVLNIHTPLPPHPPASFHFWHSQDRASLYILILKTNKMQHFSNLFLFRTLNYSDRFTVHNQESSTVHTAIGICHTDYADCLLARSGWNTITCITNIYCCVYSTRLLMMDSKPVRIM